MKINRIIIFFIQFFSPLILLSQTVEIRGKISDSDGVAMSMANVSIEGKGVGTSTNIKGNFKLVVPYEENLNIVITSIGYIGKKINLKVTPGEMVKLNEALEIDIKELGDVHILGKTDMSGIMQKIEMKHAINIPNSGNIETIIKTMGVQSNNELSSQYSVRGGSFDENLVYINEIEIYRPFLVKSGQQEGLSFVNPDLVSSLKFSAGGFDAGYGDKMSSVLDISYKNPTKNKGSVSASLLGGTAHLEGSSSNKKFKYLMGTRYRSSQYLLSTQDTKGEYKPRYNDIQLSLSYSLSSKSDLNFLGAYSRNIFEFQPSERNTSIGSIAQTLQFVSYYEGNEYDKFSTLMGALTYQYKPNKDMQLGLTLSRFSLNENESYDILGQYWLNELNVDPTSGSSESGRNIGVGSLMNHARNRLKSDVTALSHRGSYKQNQIKYRWGTSIQMEEIDSRKREWELTDSAGFFVPINDTAITMYQVLRSDTNIISIRYAGFGQATYEWEAEKGKFFTTAGIRYNYWAYNNELLISPRANISFQPQEKKQLLMYLSGGAYHQTPFYKELMMLDGTYNTKIKAQRSLQGVLGISNSFIRWGKPFKFTTEYYYKQLSNLIPYKVDNVSIEYSGKNMSEGYATGLEFKINGEFVKDAESWASISFMRTRENIEGDFFIDSEGNKQEIGYFPRPNDQLVNVNVYFQDYLPNNPTYRVYLTLIYGSRLPYQSPEADRYDKNIKLPPYRRADVGFSKILKSEEKVLKSGNPFKNFSNIILSAEILNLFDIRNTVSYMWLRTVSNDTGEWSNFPINNYLTGRRINVRLLFQF